MAKAGDDEKDEHFEGAELGQPTPWSPASPVGKPRAATGETVSEAAD